MEDDLLTMGDVAKILGMSTRGARLWVHRGWLSPVPGPRRDWSYIRRSDLDIAMNSHAPRKSNPLPTQAEPACLFDLAYIAGLFDGEGSIAIRRRAVNPNTGTYGHHLQVVITNTDLEVLEWVQSVLGSYLVTSRQKRREEWAATYAWGASTVQAASVLSTLLPFLRIKREPALVAIEFQRRVSSYKGHRHKPLTGEEVAWREEQAATIRALNKRFHDADEIALKTKALIARINPQEGN